MAILQTATGLVVFDDMERASSASMGAPTFPAASPVWTEIESAGANLGIRTHVAPTVQVAQNQNNASSSNEAYVTPGVAPAGIDTICQVNIDHDNGSFGGIRIVIGDVAPNGGIFGLAVAFVVPGGVPALQAWNYFGVVQCTAGIVFPNNRTIRLVIRDQGGGLVISAIYESVTPPSPFLVGLTQAMTLVCTSAPFASAPATLGPGGNHGVIHQRAGDSKMFIRCGRNVVMTGLPTGWGIRVDGGSVATEVAGVATLDVDGVPLPYTEVQVVDGSLVQQDQFTPITGIAEGAPAGGWGGDQYGVTVVLTPDDPTELACLCLEDELAIRLDWVDNSTDETGFRIERADDPTGPFASLGTVGPNITTFLDDTVEANRRYFYRVFAFNAGGDSGPTNVESCGSKLYPDCTPPSVPTYVKVPNAPLCPLELELLNSGLIFSDDFDRSNRLLDGDNGWDEVGGLGEWSIVGNQANCGDTDDDSLVQTASGIGSSDLIVQSEFLTGGGTINGQGLVLRFKLLDPAGQSQYLFQINDVIGPNQISIFKRVNGSFTLLAQINEVLVIPQRLRAIIENGSTTSIILRMVIDEVLKITFTDVLTPLSGATYDFAGYRVNNPAVMDDFLMCPREVTVQNVPNNFSASVDGGPFANESGGEIKVPMDLIALPATTMTLRDNFGNIADVESPVGGFFGGAIFDLA